MPGVEFFKSTVFWATFAKFLHKTLSKSVKGPDSHQDGFMPTDEVRSSHNESGTNIRAWVSQRAFLSTVGITGRSRGSIS